MRRRNRRLGMVVGALCVLAFGIFIVNSTVFFGNFRTQLTASEAQFNPSGSSETDSCTAQLVDLQSQISQLRLMQEENQHLRSLLDYYKTVSYEYVVASVASYDPFDASVIYLNQGADAGLQPGDPVVADSGFLVGKIVLVSRHAATVELLTSNSFRLAVKNLEEEAAEGVLRGNAGSSVIMEYILSEDSVTVGDTITTSGLEPLIPEGVLIGTILTVSESAGEVFKSATLKPYSNLDSLKIVSVIKVL